MTQSLATGPPKAPPKVRREDVLRLIATVPTLGALARALGVHRASIYRAERRWGLEVPRRPSHTPTREEWKSLMTEHGLSITALAAATGLRRDYVRNLLLNHGLITSWTGRRNGRWAEWTEED